MSNDIKMSEKIATLDIGHTNIEDDLTEVIVRKNGRQDFMKTLENYIETLQKSISVLTLLKESIYEDEVNDIELVSGGNCLCIRGDQQLIDRFIGFGIANYYEENWSGDENEDKDDDSASNYSSS